MQQFGLWGSATADAEALFQTKVAWNTITVGEHGWPL